MKPLNFELGAWSLDDLLSAEATQGAGFEHWLAELEQKVAQLESWRQRLSPNIQPADFEQMMELYESINRDVRRIWMYAQLWFSEDTQSQEAMSFMGRVDELRADVQNRTLFFDLWWKELDDEQAERLLAVSGDWRYFLETLRRFKPHTLSEPEEKVINLKNLNGFDALVRIYETVTNRYVFELEVDGEIQELSRPELTKHIFGPSPKLREAAYRALNRVYARDGIVLGQIYAHIVRDWRSENLALRHFASPISVRNLDNDVPDSVVDTLLGVCRQNAGLFQDYFRLKAGWLGLDKLRRFDIYAPLSPAEKEYPFAQAVDVVLDSMESFSPVIAKHARRVLEDHHLDSEVRPGKQSGAFCAGALPELSPWVLLNYTGKARDVATLAHELGHAVHAMMAGEHSVLTFHSTLPLAETASVSAEMILTHRLLDQEPDLAVRRNLLAGVLDDAYATVMRQAYFVLFERRAHQMIAEGKTSDELCEAYMADLAQQFGDAVELDEGFKWEWTAIPHIYRTPFYCYAYSFGQLLALALYQRYREEGQAFVPHFLKILAYGGSASPEHILTEAGVDMASPQFWQGGFDVIQGLVEQLKEM